MERIIESLDDYTAARILTTIAEHRLGAEESDPELPAGLKDSLRDEFNVGATGEIVSDGDMARHALLLLALDPEMGNVITTMAENPEPAQRLGPVTAIVLAAAVIAVLQTEMEFVWEDGNPRIRLKKKALPNKLLKGFVEKLLSWVPDGPFR